MDPSHYSYNNSNASHHFNPTSNQINSNASAQHVPNLAVPQTQIHNSGQGGGGMPPYSSVYNSNDTQNGAQYRAPGTAVAGQPMQPSQQGVYGQQQSVPSQQHQQMSQSHPFPTSGGSRQQMYAVPPAVTANGVNYSGGGGVPNPLLGGAPSAPQGGDKTTDLLRSMYQSRPPQQQTQMNSTIQQQGQVMQVNNYRTSPPIQQPPPHSVQNAPIQQQQQQQQHSVYHQNQTHTPINQQLQPQQNRLGSANVVDLTQQPQSNSRMVNGQPQQYGQQSHQVISQQQGPQQQLPQQQQQQQPKQRFHLSPDAKTALREAVLSAIRNPNGIVDPECLKRAMQMGLPEKAILNAAVVARERDKRNREERARIAAGQGGQMAHSQQGQVSHQQRPQGHSSQSQQQHPLSQQGGAVHLSYPQQPPPPPPSNVAPSSAKVQMQHMFPSQPTNNGPIQYNPLDQQNSMYTQQQQQQAARLHQQQQQQQQSLQRQQQAAQLQRQQQQQQQQQQFQAQQMKIAAQRQSQEEAIKRQRQNQYEQEQKRKMYEDERRRQEVEAEKRIAEEEARRNAKIVHRMKVWGRTGFGLVVKGYAKGLPQLQRGQRIGAVIRQSTCGGLSLCSDSESALVGALQRAGKVEEQPKSHPENIQKFVDGIRRHLLKQEPPQIEEPPSSEEDKHRIRLMSISSTLIEPTKIHTSLKRIKKQPPREGKFLDKHIRRARQQTSDALSKRHKELMKAILHHQTEFYKFHRLKKNDCAKVARAIRDQLRKAEVAKEKDVENNEKARIAALRANDMAAYTSLLEDTKNERLKFLLDKTDECMNRISTLLRSRAEEEEEDIKLMGGEGAIKAEFTQESATVGSYYETAHVKNEQVRQPSLLVGGELKEYQLAGLQWLVSLYNNRLNGILADEMGLGKTIQTISLIAYLIEAKQILGPYLVIVPLSTLSNWVNEFAKWLPAATLVCYKGTPQQRKQLFRDEVADGHFNVLLTTYEFVIRDKGSLKKIAWQYAIVDEGHRMKNNQSKFSITLGTQYNTRRRVLLTGTPLQNSLPELWALLNFLLPEIFNSAESFDQWFNKPFSSYGKSVTGGENGDESSNELLSNEERMLIIHRLHELLRPFMLRRIKSEVLDQLPEKVEKVIRCELSSWQKELYKQISRKIAAEANGKNFNRGLNNVVMQLRKVCNHPYLFSKDGYHINDDIIRCSGKLELLDRMLPKLKAAGHRVLMFTQMTKMMPILEDYFAYRRFTSLRLDGSTSADEREKRMYMFNAPDSPYFIFLLSTRAGGLGLNLATADTVIIFDSDWNPMMDLQAQDRAHRIGQRKDVRVFRIITQSPVEEKILSRATEKLQMNELVVEAGKFDKSGQEKEDNSLERLKMMELLLDNFDETQNAAQRGAASEEDFEKDTDDEEEEYSGDMLNEIISTNDEDYKLYCKIDLAKTNAPALYSDLNSCPDWIRYPNGKPEPGAELFEDDDFLGKRRAAAGDKVYDDGMTEKQFCRMMDKQAVAEEKGKKKGSKKRGRNAVDTSNILDDFGERKRSKTAHLDSSPSARPKKAVSDFGSGEAMHDRLLSIAKSIIYLKEKGTKRKLADIFLEKPCPQTYPDYYQLINKPIGMNDILRKCRAKLYSTANEFLDDWNTLFVNAVTYNGEGSWIVNDTRVIRAELDRLVAKNALNTSVHQEVAKAAPAAATPKSAPKNVPAKKAPVRIKLSLKMGKKKVPTPVVATPVDSDSDDDESDSDESDSD